MRRYKWMLPVKQSNLTNVDWIHPKAKYHCFFKNTSLCEKYWQDQDFFTTDIDTEEIENRLQTILTPYYRPKYILTTDCIPQTGNGKVNRAECSDLARKKLVTFLPSYPH